MVFFQPGSESQYLNPDQLTIATSTGFRPSSSTSQSDLEQVLHLVDLSFHISKMVLS